MHSGKIISFTIPLPRDCTNCRSTQLDYRGPTVHILCFCCPGHNKIPMWRAYARRFDTAADELAKFSRCAY